MKKFLKRANRGLLLACVIIFVLVIRIIIDYSRFSSEKDVIREQLDHYFKDYFESLENSDYEELKNTFNAYWTPKPVIREQYYNTISDMNKSVDEIINITKNSSNSDIKKKYTVTDTSYSIKKVSVKKSGPNMASVSIKYAASMTCFSEMSIFLPFEADNDLYAYSEKDTLYTFTSDGEYTVYMCKVDGIWKISQTSGYPYVSMNPAADKEAE